MPIRNTIAPALALLAIAALIGAVLAVGGSAPAAPGAFGALDPDAGGPPRPDVAATPPGVSRRVEVAPLWTLKVVDEAGAPVTGVPLLAAPHRSPQRAVSGADGVAGFATAMPNRRFGVRVEHRAFALVGPPSIEPAEAEGTLVVVRRRTRIAGRVVFDDEVGGVPGVELAIVGGPVGGATRTDRDGWFELFGDGAAEGVAGLQICDPGPCIPTGDLSGNWWGRDDVVIRLSRTRRVDVEVVAADTGEPLDGFGVRLRPVGAQTSDDGNPAGRGADGLASVVGAWPGLNDLQVLPDDPRYAPSEVVTFRLREGQAPRLQIAVGRRQPVEVRVVDAIGRRVEGAVVRWIDSRGRTDWPRAVADERGAAFRPRWLRAHAPVQVASAETDPRGVAVLYVDPSPHEAVIEAKPPVGERSLIRLRASAGMPQPIEVRVAARSTIRGRLAPPPPPAWHARVELRADGADGVRAAARVGQDGSFEIPDTASGAYELALFGTLDPKRADRDGGRICWLRDLVVAGGRDEVLSIDVGSLRPASIHGSVAVPDGFSVQRVQLHDGTSRLGTAELERDGRFAFPSIWARRDLRLRLHGADRDGAAFERWDAAGGFDAGWGEGVTRRAWIGDAALSVRLLKPDGSPVRESTAVWIRRDGDAKQETARTDASGFARFAALAAGRCQVWTRVGAVDVDLGVVGLAAGRTTSIVRSPR